MATTQALDLGDDRRRSHERGRGRQADSPKDLPAAGWKDVALRLKDAIKHDNVALMAAGVAFYSLIALVPALVALVSFYGLVSSPADVQRQVTDVLAAAPDEARQLVQEQLTSVVQASGAGLGLGLALGVLVALWSASTAMQNLAVAVNAAYGDTDDRGFLRTKALSLLLTLGALVFVVAAFLAITVLPSALERTGLDDASRVVVTVLRWPLLAAGLVVGLGLLYRLAPVREDARLRWVSPGSLVAAALWLLGSIGFSAYTSSFGSYDETYGSLGAVVILLLWLFLLAFAVILGAELNAELEHQTARDTTTGAALPLGRRGAAMADQVGPSAPDRPGGDDVTTTNRPAPSGDAREPSPRATEDADLAARAADVVEGAVEQVRAKTAEPVLAKVATVVLATILAFVGIAAVVLLYALVLRALVLVLPTVWLAHLVLAGAFALVGVVLLVRSRSRRPVTAHDLEEAS